MKIKGITVYSTFVLLLFCGILIFYGNSLYKEYKTGEPRANSTFNSITAQIENNSAHYTEKSLFSENDGVLSLLVTENSTIKIAFPTKEISTESRPSRFVKVFNKTIVQGEKVTEVKAALYLLRPAVIYKQTKLAFISIAALTLITALILIYTTLTEGSKSYTAKTKNQMDYTEPEEEKDELIAEETSFEETPAAKEDTSSNEDSSFKEEIQVEDEAVATKAEQSSHESPAYESTKIDTQLVEKEDSSSYSEPVTTEEPIATTTEESPYYNESAVLNKPEPDLTVRLNSSLAKAASNEQDLSLFLIKIPQDISEEKKDAVKTTLQNSFGADNTFHHETNSFACIKTDTSIDDAEDFAAEVQAKIAETLPLDTEPVYIGISSRAIRMLSADRLIMEATEAVKHAEQEIDSPIIGFHVDIEKYREFLQNASQVNA